MLPTCLVFTVIFSASLSYHTAFAPRIFFSNLIISHPQGFSWASYHLQPELSCLNALEQRLISLHVPFMKMIALPCGKQRCNPSPAVIVPSKVGQACTLLPRLPTEMWTSTTEIKAQVVIQRSLFVRSCIPWKTDKGIEMAQGEQSIVCWHWDCWWLGRECISWWRVAHEHVKSVWRTWVWWQQCWAYHCCQLHYQHLEQSMSAPYHTTK